MNTRKGKNSIIKTLLRLVALINVKPYVPFIQIFRKLPKDFRLYHSHFNNEQERRDFVRETITTLSIWCINPTESRAYLPSKSPSSIINLTIPLEWNKQEYIIRYNIEGNSYKAIVDTGSPFLMIPSICNPRTSTQKIKWGCYTNKVGQSTSYLPTYEAFDGVRGDVIWRQSKEFIFENASESASLFQNNSVVFGVASDTLFAGPGGLFFGLIRDTDSYIRPSFLGQTPIKSFILNFKSVPRTLKLSSSSLPNTESYIPLVNELQYFGDPARHYTAKVSRLLVNKNLLADTSKLFSTPIYAIIDTGVTGMLISRDLYNERYLNARQNKEKNLWSLVSVEFETIDKQTISLSATKPLTTPLVQEWKKPFKKGYVIVLGLAFLNENKISIDIDKQRLWLN